MTILPSLTAIWLVDNVTYDPTGRPTLHGVFNRVILRPGETDLTGPFTVCFSFTDVRSRCLCELKLIDLGGLEQVYERPVYLDPVGPTEVADMTIRVNLLPLSGAGEYVWELYYGSHRLGCTRMTVAESESEGETES